MNTSQLIKEKFIVLFSARTGSHLLQSLLNSHPEVFCDGELFFDHKKFIGDSDPALHIEKNKLLHGSRTAYGYLLSVYQINRMASVNDAEEFLKAMPKNGWRIIYLYRSNVARQAFSLLRARKTNIYYVRNGLEVPRQKVRLNLLEIFKTIYSLKYYRRREERLLKVLHHARVDYSLHLRQAHKHQVTIDNICNALNINCSPVSPNYMRLTSDNVNDDFVNGQAMLTAAQAYSAAVTPLIMLSETLHFYFSKFNAVQCATGKAETETAV